MMMKLKPPEIMLVVSVLWILQTCLPSALAESAFREDFSNLDNWKALIFEKVKRHSVYRIVTDIDGETILAAESDSGGSALVSKKKFNVRKSPLLRWEWRVDKSLPPSDPRSKSKDDYPLRVYVMFEYNPAKVSMLQRLQYSSLKLIYGAHPPHSSINYVWASGDPPALGYDSPYTSRVKMLPLRNSAAPLGKWFTEEVNVLADYRRLFGEDPPEKASLAIMTDSDAVKGATKAAIKFIELGAE